MNERVSNGATVSAVLKAYPISRGSLEQKCRRLLDRSLAEHIRLLRLKQLITDTELTITEIAMQIGFQCTAGLTQQFTRHFQISPTQYRASVR